MYSLVVLALVLKPHEHRRENLPALSFTGVRRLEHFGQNFIVNSPKVSCCVCRRVRALKLFELPQIFGVDSRTSRVARISCVLVNLIIC